MPEWVDHLVLGVCHAPIALTLVWLTVRGKFILVNPTVQFCLMLSWMAYVFHHLARIWPHDPDLNALTMHIKAIVAMPLVLFIWPMFRRPDTLPDRIEWERRLSEMSTVVESQRAETIGTRKRIHALAKVCKTQINRNRDEFARLRVEHANEKVLHRFEILNSAFEEVLAQIRALDLEGTEPTEAVNVAR